MSRHEWMQGRALPSTMVTRWPVFSSEPHVMASELFGSPARTHDVRDGGSARRMAPAVHDGSEGELYSYPRRSVAQRINRGAIRRIGARDGLLADLRDHQRRREARNCSSKPRVTLPSDVLRNVTRRMLAKVSTPDISGMSRCRSHKTNAKDAALVASGCQSSVRSCVRRRNARLLSTLLWAARETVSALSRYGPPLHETEGSAS